MYLSYINTWYHFNIWLQSHVHVHTNGKQANAGTLSNPALVTGAQCESGLIASSAGVLVAGWCFGWWNFRAQYTKAEQLGCELFGGSSCRGQIIRCGLPFELARHWRKQLKVNCRAGLWSFTNLASLLISLSFFCVCPTCLFIWYFIYFLEPLRVLNRLWRSKKRIIQYVFA